MSVEGLFWWLALAWYVSRWRPVEPAASSSVPQQQNAVDRRVLVKLVEKIDETRRFVGALEDHEVTAGIHFNFGDRRFHLTAVEVEPAGRKVPTDA